MVADEENFQSRLAGSEQKTQLQSSTAFKYISLHAPNRDAAVNMRTTEEFGQHSQRLFHSAHFRLAELLERGQKARAE
jgi:hypothetical protein